LIAYNLGIFNLAHSCRFFFLLGAFRNFSSHPLLLVHYLSVINQLNSGGIAPRDAGLVRCAAPVLLDELRDFDFGSYPQHVKVLSCYAWKPLLLQSLHREFPNEVGTRVNVPQSLVHVARC